MHMAMRGIQRRRTMMDVTMPMMARGVQAELLSDAGRTEGAGGVVDIMMIRCVWQ